MRVPTVTSNAFGQPIGFPVPDWKERAAPPRTAMQGRLCSVVPLDAAAHLDDLWRVYGADPDQRSWTYLFVDRPETKAGLEAYLHAQQLSDDPLCHTIIERASGRALGIASFMRIDTRMGVIEVGNINYGGSLKRTPLATEAMYLMMRRAFDELGYRRYEWKCDALNEPSKASALRLGFTYEGLFRRAVIYKGRNRDTSWFSIIAEEWPVLRRGFEAWLDPSNFDGEGRQRRSLADVRSGLIG
jgi:RimJ/RimL family protein N-acetyltransferase